MLPIYRAPAPSPLTPGDVYRLVFAAAVMLAALVYALA